MNQKFETEESLFVYWDKLCHNRSSESCWETRVNMSAYYAMTLAVNEREGRTAIAIYKEITPKGHHFEKPLHQNEYEAFFQTFE